MKKQLIFLMIIFLLTITTTRLYAETAIYSGRGLLRILSAETVGEKRICFNFHPEFTSADIYPNIIPGGMKDEKFFGLHIGATYGLLKYLDVSGHFALYRMANSVEAKTSFGDIQLSLKAKRTFKNHYTLGLQTFARNVGKEDSHAMVYGKEFYGDGALDYGAILLSSYRGEKTRTHINFGTIISPDTDQYERVNRFRWGGGLDYDLLDNLVIFTEIFGENPLEDISGLNFSIVKLTPGVRYRMANGFSFDGGVELGLTEDTPQWNIIGGFSFAYPYAGKNDMDGDGILDFDDGAPNEPEDIDGFEDENGIPDYDNDNDNLNDIDDDCPMNAEDYDGFEDEDGCPDIDNDGDGILDKNDKCPDDKEDNDGFQDEDGCPDLDIDNDGILDENDKCPEEAEDLDGIDDEDGCPETEQETEQQSNTQINQTDIIFAKKDRLQVPPIEFNFDTAIISKSSYGTLDKVIDWMLKNPTKRIEIQGHTDNIGDSKANIILSQKRADNIMNYLVKESNGQILSDRLFANGYGDQVPISSNATSVGRMKNRRVEFRILPEGVQSVPPFSPVTHDYSAYSIHTTSYRDMDNAMKDIWALEKEGIPAFWLKLYVNEKDGYWYRVVSGAFETKEDAEKTEAIVKKITHADFAKIMNLPYTIQIGVFSQQQNAITQRNELIGKKLPAYIIPVDTEKGMMYRVLIGAYETENAAHNEANKLRLEGLESTIKRR